MTGDGRSDTEIKKSIRIAKDSYKKLSTVMTSRNTSFDTKMKAYMSDVPLYGCELSTISRIYVIRKKLKASEICST